MLILFGTSRQKIGIDYVGKILSYFGFIRIHSVVSYVGIHIDSREFSSLKRVSGALITGDNMYFQEMSLSMMV